MPILARQPSIPLEVLTPPYFEWAATLATRTSTCATAGRQSVAAAEAIRTPRLLLERVRQAIRDRHYSPRTEEAYVRWTRRFILFNGRRHPAELGAEHLSAFLSALAVKENVTASTQNQATDMWHTSVRFREREAAIYRRSADGPPR